MPPSPRRSSLSALLVRRLDALEAHVPAAVEGGVAGVHQARVASRRLREVIPIVADAPPKLRARARRAARRVTRALGPVRELDVALGVLADLGQAHPELAVAISRVSGQVDAERTARRASMLDVLEAGAVDTLASRVRALAAAQVDDGASFRRLGVRLARRAGGLRIALGDAGVLYEASRLHEVRIAAKQLRYALEIAGDTRAAAVAALLARLKRVQDLLGDLHDRVIVGSLALRALDGERDHDVAAAIRRLVETLERACRLRHAGYLRRRGALVGLVDEVEDRTAPRVMRKGTAAHVGPAIRVATGPAAGDRSSKEGEPC